MTGHIPVMLVEVLEALSPADGEIYLDGTFGAGGYSRAVLKAANCQIVAIDRDPEAEARAVEFAQEFPDRFHFQSGVFSDMASLAERAGFPLLDGVMLDVGVSSFQLDQAERGFSFQKEGPLDMRMSASGESAADVVNHYDEAELADIIYRYGEERKSRRIAAAIVRARTEEPIETTAALAAIVERAIGRPRHKPGQRVVHPATRTFQALRIYVNDELGELERGLAAAERILKPGGRLVVVSFHSLEDRIVKNFMAQRSGRLPAASRHQPASVGLEEPPSFSLPKKGVVKPGEAECIVNPRARSAKLRMAVRTDAPAREAA